MKRLLLLFIVLVAIVGIAGATSYDYQAYTDYTSMNVTLGTGGSASWVSSTTGGNSYYAANVTGVIGAGGWSILSLTNPSATTYAAATNLNDEGTFMVYINLYDSGKSSIYSYSHHHPAGRWEVNVVGGIATVYLDGIAIDSSGVLAANPSYIGFGGTNPANINPHSRYWDDYVYGASEDRTVLGMPASGGYYLKKDLTTPASNGFYNWSTDTLISSNTFPSTFSRSNLSGEALVNQSIYLIKQDTGTAYLTNYTGTATYGSIGWDIGTLIANATAPYGMYQTKLGTSVSDVIIPYIAGGATIAFDADNYVVGDTATLTYTVETDYWIPGTYTYSIQIYDVYGNQVSSQAISSNTGSVTYVWQSDDTQGVYYGEIVGVPLAGGDNVLFNYDYTTLSATIKLFGYVNEDESALPISGAFVNASQGSTWSNTTSSATGYYETDNVFLTGVLLGYNTSASGYQTYWNNFTAYKQPPQINVTLSKVSHTTTDITLGGVVRDTMYHNPISGARVDIQNETSGEYWTATTNLAGFYNKTRVTEDNNYNIWGSKTGFLNSTIYVKQAVAA